jgi:hypothetical protein
LRKIIIIASIALIVIILGILLVPNLLFKSSPQQTIEGPPEASKKEIYGKYSNFEGIPKNLYLKRDGNYTITAIHPTYFIELSEGIYEIKENEIIFHQTKRVIDMGTNRPFYPDKFRWVIRWTEPIELIDHRGNVWRKEKA